MKVEDTVFAYLGTKMPERVAADFGGLADPRVEVVEVRLPLVRKIEADYGVKVLNPPPHHVLHIEHWKWPGKLSRTALYHMWYNDATGWPVRTVIVTTDPRMAHAVPEAYSFRVGERPPTSVPLSALHLWKMQAQEVLRSRKVALYPFVPVMADPREPNILLGELKGRMIEDVADDAIRGSLLSGAAFIAAGRFPAELVLAVFGGEDEMANTELGQRLVDRGRVEGRIEAKRADVLSALETRFGSVPDTIRAQVNGIADEARLDALHRLAVTVPSLAEFEAEL